MCTKLIGLISSLSCSGDTPGVGLLVLVVQGLDPLRLLELGQLGRVREPEECRCEFYQPLRIYGCAFSHIFLRGLNNLMKDDPLWLSVEKGTAWVNRHHLSIDQGSVSLLWILLGCVAEKSRTNSFLHPWYTFATADHVQFVPVHDSHQLLSHILTSLQGSLLHKIFITPGRTEFVLFP